MAAIKLPSNLRDDVRVVRLAAQLQITLPHAIGLLYTLQAVAQTTESCTPEELDQLVGHPGFTSALPADWYSIADGRITLVATRVRGQAANDGDGSRAAYMREYRRNKRSINACVTGVTRVTRNSCVTVTPPVTHHEHAVTSPATVVVESTEPLDIKPVTPSLRNLAEPVTRNSCVTDSVTDHSAAPSYISSLPSNSNLFDIREENTKEEEKENTKRPRKSRATTVASNAERFGEFLAMWGRLHDEGLVVAGVRKPSQTLIQAWNRANADLDSAQHLEDIGKLEKLIRGAKACLGESWFTATWLFRKKQDWERNVVRLAMGEFDRPFNRPKETLAQTLDRERGARPTNADEVLRRWGFRA